MHNLLPFFVTILIIFLDETAAEVPDANNRLNSPLYNDLLPLPSMYIPLNCDSFKQKGIIAWMIHKGLEVPEEDRMLFEKCGNVDKDYIVGETFLFGERNVGNMKRYSKYLRKLLQEKPKRGLHQLKSLKKDNVLYQLKSATEGHNVVKVQQLYYALYRPIVFLAMLVLAITIVSAIITVMTFINYREYP